VINRNRNGGFSLVELIVAICILAVLMTLLIPSYLSARNNARLKKDMTTVESICTALKTSLGDQEVQKEAERIGFTSSDETYYFECKINDDGTINFDDSYLISSQTCLLVETALWKNARRSIDTKYVFENREWRGKTIVFLLTAKTSSTTAKCTYAIK
jgi:prepilin-type N-terminal cleavage/methylation domain-containing protein